MKIKILALATLLALMWATPASAHHPEHEPRFTAVTSCADSDGSYTVDWTVTSHPADGLEWSAGGQSQPDTQPFTFHVWYDRDDSPGASLSRKFVWSNGDVAGRTFKVPAGEPCTSDSVPDTVVDTLPPETLPPSTPVPTIGEIPGPADVSTTSTVVAVDVPPVSTTTTIRVVEPAPATLPKTGATETVVLFLASVCVGAGIVLLVNRSARRP